MIRRMRSSGTRCLAAWICSWVAGQPRMDCISKTTSWETPEAYAELMKLIPYKRIGEPEDIARATAWMASDDADYVQGVSFFVDGGMTLYPGFATGG